MRKKPAGQAAEVLGPMRSTAVIQAKLENHLTELQATLLPESLNDVSVHRNRVLIKKLRAWIRLVRPIHPTRDSELADKKLRSLGHALSGLRDRKVLKDTLKSLAKNTDNADAKKACAKLGRRLGQTGAASSLPSALGKTIGKIRLPDATRLNQSALLEGLRANYTKARKLGGIALADTGHPEKLHRFRRWVKHLYYQLKLLYPLQNSAVQQPRLLNELGATLGEIHDLHVLIEALAAAMTPTRSGRQLKNDAESVTGLANQRACEMTSAVVANTRLLFAAKPKKFMALLS